MVNEDKLTHSIREAGSYSYYKNCDKCFLTRVCRVLGSVVVALFCGYLVKDFDVHNPKILKQYEGSYFLKKYQSRLLDQRVIEAVEAHKPQMNINQAEKGVLQTSNLPSVSVEPSVLKENKAKTVILKVNAKIETQNTSNKLYFSTNNSFAMSSSGNGEDVKPVFSKAVSNTALEEATSLLNEEIEESTKVSPIQVNTFKNKDQAFTTVRMTNGVLVELLNTLPKDVLNELKIPGVDQMRNRNTGKLMSNSAITALNISPDKIQVKNRTKYLGEGSFGVVKFARIKMTNGEQKIIAAKKINIKYKTVDEVEAEKKIQAKAGDSIAPAVYGIAYRDNKKGINQSILFMDIGGTGAGEEMRKTLRGFGKNCPKLALLLFKQVIKLQQRSIYPIDLKWDNVCISLNVSIMVRVNFGMPINLPQNYFENNQCKLKIIDFGEASESKKILQFVNEPLQIRYPPELLYSSLKPSNIDCEKIVVWHLGLMIVDLFFDYANVEHPFYKNLEDLWYPSNQAANESKYAQILEQSFEANMIDGGYRKNFRLFEPILRQMLAFNPEHRLGIEQAYNAFEKLITGPAT